MSQIVKPEEQRAALKKNLLANRGQILEALPQHVDPERMFRVYLTAVQTTPGILKCTPISVIGAVMRSAQFGLSLETVTGEAFLVPRWNKHARTNVASFQIGYKGLRKLARQGDTDLRDIFSYPVYENDIFSYTLGLKPDITVHQPAKHDGRGKLLYAYAVAVWKQGPDESEPYRRFRLVDHGDIEIAMRTSGGKDGPSDIWKEHPAAMWQKTAIRRLCDSLTLSSDVAARLAADDTDGTETLREMGAKGRAIAANLDLDPGVLDDGDGDGSAPEASDEPKGDALDKAAAEAEAEKPKTGNGRRRRR